jgi:RNA 2',3'-cyclic 3'-phosphodiesterase
MSDRAGLTARLFLALVPSVPEQNALAAVGRELGKRWSGRLTRTDTVHMTLVFIGPLARERIPLLLDRLARLAVPAFQLELTHSECWRHNKVAVLTPASPPAALFTLVKDLEARLDDLAIAFDRRPYRPHVTLLRKADCAKENPAQKQVSDMPERGVVSPIVWAVEQFVLLESVATPAGVRYDTVETFAMG